MIFRGKTWPASPFIYAVWCCCFIAVDIFSWSTVHTHTHTPKRNFVTLHFKNLFRLMDVSVAVCTVCMDVTLIKLHVIWSIQNAILCISLCVVRLFVCFFLLFRCCVCPIESQEQTKLFSSSTVFSSSPFSSHLMVGVRMDICAHTNTHTLENVTSTQMTIFTHISHFTTRNAFLFPFNIYFLTHTTQLSSAQLCKILYTNKIYTNVGIKCEQFFLVWNDTIQTAWLSHSFSPASLSLFTECNTHFTLFVECECVYLCCK